MAMLEIDTSEFKTFFQRMEKATQGDFKRDFQTFLEGIGEEFLRIVQDEFINRNKNTGYGQLVSSFTRAGANNIWRYEDDGLTLEVGSSLAYASYANDGHRTFGSIYGRGMSGTILRPTKPHSKTSMRQWRRTTQ